MRLKAKELRKMDVKALKEKLNELRLELLKERGAIKARKGSKNTKKIRELRRNIARILTVLNEKR